MYSLLYNSFKNAIKRDKAELAQVLASVSILFKKLRTEFVEKPANAGKTINSELARLFDTEVQLFEIIPEPTQSVPASWFIQKVAN